VNTRSQLVREGFRKVDSRYAKLLHQAGVSVRIPPRAWPNHRQSSPYAPRWAVAVINATKGVKPRQRSLDGAKPLRTVKREKRVALLRLLNEDAQAREAFDAACRMAGDWIQQVGVIREWAESMSARAPERVDRQANNSQ